MNSPLKFWQLNSELSHMKYYQELYQLDLQAVKIQLGHFWECFMCDNSELSSQNFSGEFILPYLLTWVMIYSFRINTDFVTMVVNGDSIKS